MRIEYPVIRRYGAYNERYISDYFEIDIIELFRKVRDKKTEIPLILTDI